MAGLSTGNGLPNVVVTGVAMSTALATDAESTWKRLLDGQSGIRKLTDWFVEEYDHLPVRIGGHLPVRPASDRRGGWPGWVGSLRLAAG